MIALGGERDRLQARRAEAVDRDRRRGDRNAGAQAGDPRDVQALLGLRHRAAEDHVVDLRRRRGPARAAAPRAIDGRRELVGPRAAQRAVRRLADGGPDGGNDDASCMTSSRHPSNLPADPRARRRPR